MADVKITEKYEYLTDIITSYSGIEQRVALRDEPRHYVSYSYPAMNSYQAQWLRGITRMNQGTALYVPMWHNALYLTEEAISGTKQLKVEDTSMFSLRNCRFIEVFSKDDYYHKDGFSSGDFSPMFKGANNYYQVKSYGSSGTAGTIGVSKGMKHYLNPLNTWVYPLIKCSFQPITGLQYMYSNGTQVTLNLEDIQEVSPVKVPAKYLVDYFDNYTDRNPYKIPYTYNGEQVLTIRPQWDTDDSMSLDVEKKTNKLDNEFGIFEYDNKSLFSYDKSTSRFLLINKAMINNMIKFFIRVKGRCKSFYMPSWVNDFQPCKDIVGGTNYIYTVLDGMYKYYITNKRKNKIIIFTKDYSSYVFNVISITSEEIGGYKYGKLLLGSPISTTIPLNNIAMISYFNHVRLDNDELSIEYETTQVASVNLVTKEVDD